MNLYIFNELSPAGVYGIGTYVRELTKTLHHSNIAICVVNLMSDKPQILTEEIDGVKHWYLPSAIPERRTIEIQKQNKLYYRNVVYLLQLFIEDKTDLIFHLNYNHSGKLAEELKKVFDCRIVATTHYFDWCFNFSGNVTRFKQLLASPETHQGDELKKSFDESYRKEQEFLGLIDHIVCLSENTQKILYDDYQIMLDKTNVIYNGLSDSSSVTDKQTLRQKYHIPDVPIIFFAGRLEKIKGLTYALRAFRIVLKTLPHCHFIIAGKGSFDIYLQECVDIWTHVTWTGLINREKLYELYSIADIGIIPSFTEQCSYVAIEMMMHGLPIIGSATAGLKKMVEDGETGSHIPMIEYDDRVEIEESLLAEKMLYLLQHPEERQRMGTNARRRYETVYSAEIFRENMLNFYHSLHK